MALYYTSAQVRENLAAQIVLYVLRLFEILLALRFFLRLFGANPGAGFTDFIYSISRPFIAPFANVFRVSIVPSPTGTTSVFEWTTLLAMLVYWIIAIIILRLLVIGRPEIREVSL